MQPNQVETTPQIQPKEYFLEARTKQEWASHFGIGSREIIGFINAALQGIIVNDEVIRTSWATSEKGNTRRRLLTALHLETIRAKEGEAYVLSVDVQKRIEELVTLRNPERGNEKPLRTKEINGLIPELNFHEMKILISLVQKEHPEWFLESDHPRRTGGRSWWLKRKCKAFFLEASKPHIVTIISRRKPPGWVTVGRSSRFDTNTAWLSGWWLSGYEDVLDGYYE